MIICWSCCRK